MNESFPGVLSEDLLVWNTIEEATYGVELFQSTSIKSSHDWPSTVSHPDAKGATSGISVDASSSRVDRRVR